MINEAQIERYIDKLQKMHESNAALVASGQGPSTEVLLEYIVFSLGLDEYAFPLGRVKSVVALPKITPVPYQPSYYRGVINLRGQIVSVIDLRSRLQMEPAQPTLETSVIILDLKTYCVGVIVDSINRVLYVNNVDEVRPVSLLDVEATLESGKL